MESLKTIFVTGVTGKQGNAVAHHLMRHGFKVRALARDPAAAPAHTLTSLGVDIIPGDLNRPDTFRDHLKDVHGIFCVLTHEQPGSREIRQGIALADLAKEYHIRHFIYSSVSGADLHTGIPHWESKWAVERHIQQLGIPYTIIRPAGLYENFLIPQVRSALLKGRLVSPVGKELPQYLIAADDVGRIAAGILAKPAPYLGKTITIAAEQLDAGQIAAVFSESLGRKVDYQKLPGLIVRLAMGRKLHKMCRWLNLHSGASEEYRKAMADGRLELQEDFPELISLRQWIQDTFKATK